MHDKLSCVPAFSSSEKFQVCLTKLSDIWYIFFLFYFTTWLPFFSRQECMVHALLSWNAMDKMRSYHCSVFNIFAPISTGERGIVLYFDIFYHICTAMPLDRRRVMRMGLWKYLQEIFQKSRPHSCCVRCLTWRIMPAQMGHCSNWSLSHLWRMLHDLRGHKYVVWWYF